MIFQPFSLHKRINTHSDNELIVGMGICISVDFALGYYVIRLLSLYIVIKP